MGRGSVPARSLSRAPPHGPRRAPAALPPARPAARRAAAGARPASARCPTCPRRTTGSAATSSSTSGSPRASPGGASSTWRAARATAPTCSPARRASVIGVDANPEAFEHARLRYTRARTCASSATWSRPSPSPCDAVVFLQTIEHVAGPRRGARALQAHARGPAASPTSRRRTCSRSRPKGAERSGNPWHVREYRAEEFRALCERALRRRRAARPLPRAQAARARARARATRAGTRPPRGWASRKPVLRPLHPGDLRRATSRCARRRGLDRALDLAGGAAAMSAPRRRWRSSCTRTCPTSRASGRGRSARSGCGRRSRPRYLPLLDVLDDAPAGHAVAHAVLADQLEAPGALERCLRVPARDARARRTRSTLEARARRRCGPALEHCAAALRARARTRCERSAATCSARSAPHVAGPRRRRTPCCRCCHRRRRAAAAADRDRRAPRALRRAGAAASGCPSARTRRGSTRCSRRPACTPPAST